MRYGTYFPVLAGCCALMLLAATASRTVGQNGGLITDESTPAVEPAPPTTITVKPGEAATPPATSSAPAPSTATAPAKPATPGMTPAAAAAEIASLTAEITKLEAAADQALANQLKIDTQLAELAKTIEQARIYAARSGKKNTTTP